MFSNRFYNLINSCDGKAEISAAITPDLVSRDPLRNILIDDLM